MHIAALLLMTAVSQTRPDGIFHDGYEAGVACPAMIEGDTGLLGFRQISDIFYRDNPAHLRRNMDVTLWDSIWGHIDEFDDLVDWPGVTGSSPTIRTVGKTEFVAASFHVPIDASPLLYGKFKHVLYGGGPDVDATISRTCGDFESRDQGCYVHNWASNDNFTLFWRVSSANRFYCHLDPGFDYFVNIRFSSPQTTGPDCHGSTCQMTFQHTIGYDNP
jgi:hypothetical protein